MATRRPAAAPAVGAADLPGGDAAWTDLPDALLQAAGTRLRERQAPDRLAGLRILDDAAAGLLEELAPHPPGAPAGGDADDRITEARSRFAAVLAGDDPFARLVRRSRLSVEAAELLALLVAVEVDPGRQRLVAFLQDDVTRPRPTLHLVHVLLGAAGLRCLTEDGELRRRALVALAPDGAFASRQVAVPAPVTWAVLGVDSPDPDLPPSAELLTGLAEGDGGPPILVTTTGPDRTRRLQAAVGATGASGALVVEPPGDPVAWEAIVRTATLQGAAVVLELDGNLPPSARRCAERADHLSWVLSSPAEVPTVELPERPWIDAPPAAPAADAEEIRRVLGDEAADVLGHGHLLHADQLLSLHRTLPAVGGDAAAAVRRLAASRLEQIARRITPRRQWDDLVLLPDQEAALRELLSRYRDRDVVYGDWGVPAYPSAGVVALLSGPSGTGKTTAAEIVAGQLGLDLFVVDLSAVVSKYIGETEKNLEGVFDAASAGNLVLLFDEADALFGKRSEVSDARDRYANMEVAYLLQRLETFDGLLILTTNLARNLDSAFLRRLHVAIDFPTPEPAERRRIWERSLGAGAPLASDLDIDFLADHLELTGGVIRNTCLTAAFLAADAGGEVTMARVVLSVKREFQKLGRLCTPEDFGPWYRLVADPA